MDLMYFKRYRMEITLAGRDLAAPRAPEGYRFEPWNPALLEAFAEAKYLSFRGEIDANVFPCLGELDGCRRLMREIVRKPGFLPETTWLLTYGRGSERPEFCGTVQGIRDVTGWAPSRTWALPPNTATAAWARICSSTPCRVSARPVSAASTWK